jgi:hypothetical protein
MIEFMLKDRRVRLINDVFYARAICRGIETKKEKWSKVSFSNSHGYLICNLNIDKRLVRIVQHRLVWYAHHQDWNIWDTSSANSIDHRNQNKKDNRLCNLRKATHSENKQNVNHKGCNFDKRSNKWRARIKLNGKDIYIGLYATEEEAHEAYLAKKRNLHPYFVEDE